ncbi:MAG: hypothetical protein JW782_07650 [Candidatus Saganbacteria bacterium]|nr:hypothetical protein [Candidatus Saganbacteria bacterium]
MELLLFAGIIALIFGVLSLFSREMLLYLGDALNRPIVSIDDKLKAIRIPLGLVLVVIAGWIISVAFSYPTLWYLHIIGIVILFFGLLYLFVPRWLDHLSRFLDQTMLSTDEILIGLRKAVGIVLMLAAIYIFYSVYLVGR